jgi:hypothetical protein
MTPEHTALIRETLQRAAARHGWLTRELSIQAQVDGRDAPMLPAELAQGPLGQGLADIAAAAEGQPVDRALLLDTVQHVCEALFVPLWGDCFAFPDEFDSTPLGQMIMAARLRTIDAADIMTPADAARVLGRSRQRINDLLNDGSLPFVVLSGERRPLRSGVEAYRQRAQG